MVHALDVFLNILIWIINNTLLKYLPTDYAQLPVADLLAPLQSISTTFGTAFNFIDYFLPIGWIFSGLVIVIIAEIALHLGWKGTKYAINVSRGSGG